MELFLLINDSAEGAIREFGLKGYLLRLQEKRGYKYIAGNTNMAEINNLKLNHNVL